MKAALCVLVLGAGILLSCCSRQRTVLVTGRTSDAGTGSGLPDVSLIARRAPESGAYSSKDGYYVLSVVRTGDTVDVRCAGYRPAFFTVPEALVENGRVLRDVALERIPDTAYTPAGPVDASIFFDDTRMKRKKLSPNEARLIVMEKFPGVQVRNGMLIEVNGREEWYFEMKFGHSLASVYINAFTAEIRSVESEDPNLDRRLQQMLEDAEQGP